MGSDVVTSQIIEQLDRIMQTNSNITDLYQKFLAVLSTEEDALLRHDITLYEETGERKKNHASEILTLYRLLVEACEAVQHIAARNGLKMAPISSLGELPIVLMDLVKSIKLSELDTKILEHQIELLRSSIETFLTCQKESKEFVERNVMLVTKLLDNHRNSFQFWRDAISIESVGYNSRGVRGSTHAVSMFNAKV